MENILDKISSYNLFNNLLPGVLFVAIASEFTSYFFFQENLFIGAFVYYFIGLVISRFGSLAIEPALKKISFIKYAPYEAYVSASKKDSKIDIFLETNNMYRTLSSMILLLLLLKLYEFLEAIFPLLRGPSIYFLALLLLIMFLFSYRKQTEYIKKRIKVNKNKV